MKKIFNMRDIKIIAYITMLIDHIGAILVLHLLEHYYIYDLNIDIVMLDNLYTILRTIGRLAFPLFVFSIVEGYQKTRDVKKYMVRLFIFSIISEIPFDYALFGEFMNWSYQNVGWTLLLGLVVIYLYDLNKGRLSSIFIALAGMVLAELMKTDYGAYGVALIFAFYVFRDFKYKYLFWTLLLVSRIYPAFAIIPIYFYNGEKGMKSGRFLYYFYPIHFIILAVIRLLIILHFKGA